MSRRRAEVLWSGLVAALLTVVGPAAEPPSPGGRATFFDLEITGRRVVFVGDRSASMSEPEGRPLAQAKRELLASLESLGESRQFHLLFYNDRVTVFTPPGGRGRPMFADEETLRGVRRFVASLSAAGGTRHANAVAAALALAPDEIFLLTDGEARDDLAEDEFQRLAGRLGRTRLMVVQFGAAAGNHSPRLARLAAMSGGKFRVVDPVGGD